MTAQVWLITASSSGFGKFIALEALKRGDKVIATARGDFSRLSDLKEAGAHIMQCDVTVPVEEMREIAKAAEAVYGRVDVLLNNAGFANTGTLEELG